MALTDTAIRKAKPKDKPYKVSDSGGLYLLVNPIGSKLWRVKYRLHGVERKLALGAYPLQTWLCRAGPLLKPSPPSLSARPAEFPGMP